MSFSSEEIFEIALQIEHNGVSFYKRAAGLVTDGACRQLLTDLAAMEEEHVAIFDTMRGPSAESEDEFGGDDEMLSYIRAMADGHVFDVGIDPGEILTGEETLEEILSTAIGLEKESIVYYSALKEVVSDASTQRRVGEIIHEEMSHIALLSGQRELLR